LLTVTKLPVLREGVGSSWNESGGRCEEGVSYTSTSSPINSTHHLLNHIYLADLRGRSLIKPSAFLVLEEDD